MLGAPALVALAVAGCGAAASQPKLHNTAEQRLLSLVARARADATEHDGAGVHSVLGEFVSDVQTLTAAGQLSPTTAGRLDRAARATAAQAARQLHPASKVPARTASTTTQATGPGTTTSPPVTNPPAVKSTPPTQHDPPPASGNPAGQANQGYNGSEPAQPGHGPRHDHGHWQAHDGWSVAGQGGAGSTWAQWWNYVTGGRGD